MSASASPRSLTAREAQVAMFLEAGLKPKQIALKTRLSPSTIRTVAGRARRKIAAGAPVAVPECVEPECGRLLRGYQVRYCSSRCETRVRERAAGRTVGPFQPAALSGPMRAFVAAFQALLYARGDEPVVRACAEMAFHADHTLGLGGPRPPRHIQSLALELNEALLPNLDAYIAFRRAQYRRSLTAAA